MFASSLFTALSNGKASAIISLWRTFGFITVLLLILSKFLKVTGVWLAIPIAELHTLMPTIYLIFRYRKHYNLFRLGIISGNKQRKLAAAALHFESQRIAKTLSFMVEGKAMLIVTAGDAKIDNPTYKAKFGKKEKMLTLNEVESFVGHAVPKTFA